MGGSCVAASDPPYRMFTSQLVVTGTPSKGGTVAPRNAAAMQPPVGVPWNGGLTTFADVTRPDGAKVMLTLAPPLGSSGCLQLAAAAAAMASAVLAALLLNSTPPEASASSGAAAAAAVLVGAAVGAPAAPVPTPLPTVADAGACTAACADAAPAAGLSAAATSPGVFARTGESSTEGSSTRLVVGEGVSNFRADSGPAVAVVTGDTDEEGFTSCPAPKP